MTPLSHSPKPAVPAGVLPGLGGSSVHPGSLKALWLMILTWLDMRAALRADLQSLALLDDRARDDLGLSPADVDLARDAVKRELRLWR